MAVKMLRRFEPYAYTLLRIVSGLLFLFHGLQKFGVLGGGMVPLMGKLGLAAIGRRDAVLLPFAGRVHLQR